MDRRELEELIPELWDENISQERKKEIEGRLKEAGYSAEELRSLGKLYASLDELPLPEPRHEMTAGFYRRLHGRVDAEDERQGPAARAADWWRRAERSFFPRLGYALAFTAAGWFLGFWLTPSLRYEKSMTEMAVEIQDMKEMVALNLLRQSSSTDRIRAVSLVQGWDAVNGEVASALLKTLNSDPSVNVRLVTVEALSRFVQDPQVREGLILSINSQESPLVQLALADLMAGINEKDSVPYLQQLLEKKDLNYAVRERIEDVVRML